MDLGGLADKAKNLVEQNPDKVDTALEKAGELAKDRFGHDEQVDTAVSKIKDATPGAGSE
jgi:MT0933-like antitoxin protein